MVSNEDLNEELDEERRGSQALKVFAQCAIFLNSISCSACVFVDIIILITMVTIPFPWQSLRGARLNPKEEEEEEKRFLPRMIHISAPSPLSLC